MFAKLEDVLHWRERCAGPLPVLGLDVPMGLPARAGPRACDRQARRELGRRWMTVFAPPDRELLGRDFAAARAIVHRRRRAEPDDPHPVMSHQTINIGPKIAEADRLLRADPGRQQWMVEIHPELSFQEMAGGGLDPKRTAAGAAHRLALVTAAFPDAPARLAETPWPRSAVARDDMLDAYAVLWSTLRFAGACNRLRVLGDGARDGCGLRQRIVV